MSRPKPTILKEFVDKKTYKTEQVLQSEAIWAVFFQSQPFNLKSANMLTSYPGPKYKKTSFSNPGHFHIKKSLRQTASRLAATGLVKVQIMDASWSSTTLR